jgi:hypothetical protein
MALQLYFKALPLMTFYSTFMGITTGLELTYDKKPIDRYASIIGFTSIGIVTGLTYPVSFPVLGWYVFYK